MSVPAGIRHPRLMLGALAVVVALAASLGVWRATPARAASLPTPDHVVVVMFENHAYSQVIGSSSAPYINSLKTGGANLTRPTPSPTPASPTTTPSSPAPPRASPTTAASPPASAPPPNLGLRADRRRQDLGQLQRDACPARARRPAAAATTRRSTTRGSASPTCRPSTAKTFAQFPTDYTTLPKVSFVVPNLCSDMHDCSVSTGDTWLQEQPGRVRDLGEDPQQPARRHLRRGQQPQRQPHPDRVLRPARSPRAAPAPPPTTTTTCCAPLEDLAGLTTHAGNAASALGHHRHLGELTDVRRGQPRAPPAAAAGSAARGPRPGRRPCRRSPPPCSRSARSA